MNFVGCLHRFTKLMHGHTNIEFIVSKYFVALLKILAIITKKESARATMSTSLFLIVSSLHMPA